MRIPSRLLFAAATLVAASTAYAIDVVKTNTGTNLADAASWVGGVAPTGADRALINASSNSGAMTVDSAVTWNQLHFDATTPGAISITGSTINLNGTGDGATASTWTFRSASTHAVTIDNDMDFGTGSARNTIDVTGVGLLTLNGDITATGGTGQFLIRGTTAGILNGTITSATQLAKVDNGTWSINSDNTGLLTGGTKISAGTLLLGHNGALGTGTITIENGTTAASGTIGVVAGTGARTLANNVVLGLSTGSNLVQNLTLNSTNGNITLNGNITEGTFGVGSKLTVSGGNTVTLTGTNTYSGGTTINGGTTLALSGGNNRLLSTGTVTFSGAGTLNVGSTEQTLANMTVGNTITATVNGVGGKLTLTGSSFALGGGASQTNTLNMSGLTTFDYNNAAGAFRVSGSTTGVVAGGAGVLTLAGTTNTITALTFGVGDQGGNGQNSSVNQGTVNLGVTNTIESDTITIGGTRGAGTLRYLTGNNTSLTLRGSDGSSRVNSMILSNHAGPNISGAQGTVNLTTNVSGTSTLDAMITTLTIGKNTRTNDVSGSAIINTGTFTMGGGTLDATTIFLAQNTAGFTNGGATSKTTGNLTVTGGTIKVGNFYFADQNTSGSTGSALEANFNLNGGANLYAANIAKGPGTGTHTATRTFNWNDGTVHNYDASTNLTFGTGITVKLAATGTHTFDIDSGRTATVASVLSDATTGGTLVKAGAGFLTLTGANTYSGGTTLNSGFLRAAGGALGTGQLTINGGTLTGSGDSTTTSTFANAVLFGGNAGISGVGGFGGVNFTNTVDLGGATRTITVGQTTVTGATFGGVVSNGGISKAGVGELVLNGNNSYAGGTTINAGTLTTGHTSALGSGSATVNTGGTLNVNGFTLANAVTVNGGTLTGGAGSTLTGAITVGASGVNVASGANLVLNGNMTLATGAITTNGTGLVANAGTLILGGSGMLDLGGVFDGYTGGSTYKLISGSFSGTFANAVNVSGYNTSVWNNVSFDINTGNLVFTAIPEPSTYGLIGAGALAAAAFVRRRRKAAGLGKAA